MLVAFEGIDGSGKNTQARKLADRITAERSPAEGAALFSFPDYENSTVGPQIRHYLKGELGKLHDNHPFLVANMFALERFEKRNQILDALVCHRPVICDRYVPSNLAHQAAKIYDGPRLLASAEWEYLIQDIVNVEYGVLSMPMPNLVIYLDLTAEQSFTRTHARDSAPDLHQDDIEYLRKTRAIYKYLASRDDCWRTVPCFDMEGQPRSIEEIHDEIFEIYAAASK